MDIASQTGASIYNVEYNELPQRDHLECGIALLRQSHYAEARRELSRAVAESPDEKKGHYYMALALLDGARPNRRPRTVLARVRSHLRTAATLTEARVLHLMVEEDDGFRWRHHTRIPQELFDLVDLLDGDHVGELLTHVPARGTRTYKVLEMASDRDEPDRS
jgi:hypothetical protein